MSESPLARRLKLLIQPDILDCRVEDDLGQGLAFVQTARVLALRQPQAWPETVNHSLKARETLQAFVHLDCIVPTPGMIHLRRDNPGSLLRPELLPGPEGRSYLMMVSRGGVFFDLSIVESSFDPLSATTFVTVAGQAEATFVGMEPGIVRLSALDGKTESAADMPTPWWWQSGMYALWQDSHHLGDPSLVQASPCMRAFHEAVRDPQWVATTQRLLDSLPPLAVRQRRIMVQRYDEPTRWIAASDRPPTSRES